MPLTAPARKPTKPLRARTRTIFIEDEPVVVFDESVPLGDIRLDPENPRIRHAVRQKFGGKTPTQEQLADLIYETSGVSDLFKSIRDTGGLQDPIHVLDGGIVAEGNCRAACFMRLAKAQPANTRWNAIECIRLPNTITSRQVAVLQGQFHVAGKVKWRAAEKAGHIYAMNKNEGMDPKAIARALGMHENKVKRLLAAYQVWTTQIVPKVHGKDALKLWSHAEEYFKSSELSEHRSVPANVEWFVKQVVTGKIERGEDVRKLAKIMKSKPAVRALEKGGVKKAVTIVSKKDPTADSKLLKKISDTTEALRKVRVDDLHLLKEPKPNQLLAELLGAARNLLKTVQKLPKKK
jgi:hypothetical protein